MKIMIEGVYSKTVEVEISDDLPENDAQEEAARLGEAALRDSSEYELNYITFFKDGEDDEWFDADF